MPEPFAVEAQAVSLSRPVIVELVEFAHQWGPEVGILA